MAEVPKKSKVEDIKEGSRHLRGTLQAELADENVPNFLPDSTQLLKFHGMYQQDDRDTRKELKKAGKPPAYSLMIRTRMPGGVMTAPQLKALLEIADNLTEYGTLRITTRQTFQIHGVLKNNVKAVMQEIHRVLMTTLGACGDVERNIMACPLPKKDPLRNATRELAHKLATQFEAQSNAYHEIWLDGKQIDPGQEIEPLYGENYLPRKFKTGISLADDNCIDVYSNDLGLVVISDDGKAIQGYNIMVGGGMGRKVARKDTFARLASPMGFLKEDQVIPAMGAVLKTFKDHGNRADRARARIKYLVEDWGVDKFRTALEKEMGFSLDPFVELPHLHIHDHLGWTDLGDGTFSYGVFIPNGRIEDTKTAHYKSFLKAIVNDPGLSFYNTAEQKIIVAGIKDGQQKDFEQKMSDYGIALVTTQTSILRHAMACVALPTCGLAVAESERVSMPLFEKMERLLNDAGLGQEDILVRMTGCPNGCARPYNATVGIVGKTLNKYDVFLGGNAAGTRIARPYLQTKTLEDIEANLKILFQEYKQNPADHKTLADFLYSKSQT